MPNMVNTKIFRIDDVSMNTNMESLQAITNYLFKTIEGVKVIYGLSPLTHNNCGERVFPKILNAHSEYQVFYNVNRVGLPEIDERVIRAGHGIIHVDHRLLDYQTQELSILTSCSLAGGKIFIPPFNKYNYDTEVICDLNKIELIKFEDGWGSCEYNNYDAKYNLWYLHGYAWTFEKFKAWIEA